MHVAVPADWILEISSVGEALERSFRCFRFVLRTECFAGWQRQCYHQCWLLFEMRCFSLVMEHRDPLAGDWDPVFLVCQTSRVRAARTAVKRVKRQATYDGSIHPNIEFRSSKIQREIAARVDVVGSEVDEMWEAKW